MKIIFEEKPKLKIGLIIIKEVNIKESCAELIKLMDNAVEETRKRYSIEKLNTGNFAFFRKLWWKYDMDPTKLRPACEALTRRILLGKNLYKINNIVDISNILALKYSVPIGLHDLDKLKGDLILRKAKSGELFNTIGTKNNKELNGNEVIVSDQEKPIELGLSTSSSDLTKINDLTKNVLFIIFNPLDNNLNEIMENCINLTLEHCNGKVEQKEIFS